MALQSSGAISMSQINTELGYSATANISLNTTAIRALAGVPSGVISLSDFYGKSNGPANETLYYSRTSQPYYYVHHYSDEGTPDTIIDAYFNGISVTVTTYGWPSTEYYYLEGNFIENTDSYNTYYNLARFQKSSITDNTWRYSRSFPVSYWETSNGSAYLFYYGVYIGTTAIGDTSVVKDGATYYRGTLQSSEVGGLVNYYQIKRN